MKKCTACNKEYDDDKMFCPLCGNQLTDVTSAPAATEPDTDSPPSWFENWGGTVFAGIGLIVFLKIWIAGLIFAAAGAICGWISPNKVNKALSIVICIITFLLFICFLPRYF